MIPVFFSSARMILSECHESPTQILGLSKSDHKLGVHSMHIIDSQAQPYKAPFKAPPV